MVTMSGFSVVFLVAASAASQCSEAYSSAGFADRLVRHFERKIAAMSTAPIVIAQ
jgi:hypothetical protein